MQKYDLKFNIKFAFILRSICLHYFYDFKQVQKINLQQIGKIPKPNTFYIKPVKMLHFKLVCGILMIINYCSKS